MRSYKQLTQEQRYHIQAHRKIKMSMEAIAKELKVHKSTISREIRRNIGKRGYRAKQANEKAHDRKKKARKKKKMTSELQEKIRKGIMLKWSPEQVVGHLKKEEQIKISIQTIYTFVRKDKLQGGALFGYLRFGKKRYRKKYGSKEARGQIKNRVSIDLRPSIVDQKLRCGDWEGDTIIGKGRRVGLITLVERKTKFTMMIKADSKRSDLTAQAINRKLAPIKNKVLTLTTDNGKEFADHEKIADVLDLSFFFAHPYSSWERGLNENTNGLIRQYFDKKTDFRNVTNEQVAFVEKQLNTRPRKALGFETPQALFTKELIGRCY